MTLRFAVAAGIGGLLLAGSASAQPTTAPAPTVVAPAPVVASGPVVTTGDVVTTTPVRRGLFGRLRNRNTTTGPVMTTTPLPATVQPPVAPAPAAVPAPLPTGPVSTGGYYARVMPASGTMTGTVVTAGSPMMMRGTVVTAGGPVMMGGTVMPASGMMVMTDGTPVMMTTYTEPVTVRRGLFGRLRVAR